MEENERIKLVLDEYAVLTKTVKVILAERSVSYSLIHLEDIERIKNIEGISKYPKVEIFQQTDIKHLFNECLRTLWRPPLSISFIQNCMVKADIQKLL